MPIYRIAELNIKIEPKYKETADRLLPYLTDSEDFELEASAGKAEIERYIADSGFHFTPENVEGPIIYTQICKAMLKSFNGFFFHSSSLMLDGEGYLFTALSGTGKSTHTRMWRELFGGKVTMINDDKPIIRRIDGRFYVCGTPWMGKSDIGQNVTAPVKAVYVLKRGDENKAVRVKPGEVFRELFEATLLPDNSDSMNNLLELFDGLFSQAKLFLLTCKPETDAARAAYEAARNE